MKNKIILFFATGFGTGYIPKAPGSFGTAAGILIYWYLLSGLPPLLYSAVTLILVIAGIFISTEAEKLFFRKDDQRIVIDEIAGIIISLIFLPVNAYLAIAGYVIFRILDIYKLPFIKKLQALPSGIGIMFDDITSGIITNVILQLAVKIFF